MNRQSKRAMKKQEQEKQKAVARPNPKATAAQSGRRERTKPRQFVKEVIGEMKKVAWPSRQETIGYSIVVLVSVIIIAALIFGMDLIFTKAVLSLFGITV